MVRKSGLKLTQKLERGMKEIENEIDFEYFGNLLFLDSTLSKAYDQKPTEQLQKMIIALNDIRHYVHHLQAERRAFQKVINQHKSDRLTLTRTVTKLQRK
jgi:hypothetical protein